MASNAGKDEIILLFCAREHKKISKMFDLEASRTAIALIEILKNNSAQLDLQSAR
jgi:hypothetical protein